VKDGNAPGQEVEHHIHRLADPWRVSHVGYAQLVDEHRTQL
jgi:hypothetical protein